MNFSFESIVAKIDYTEWLTSEIRSACKLITGDEFPGEQAMGQRAKELAALIQKREALPSAVLYLHRNGKASVRVATPFNINTLLSQQESLYRKEGSIVYIGTRYALPEVAGFTNYAGEMRQVQASLPGVKVVPFNSVFAMNVAAVAAATKYVVVGGVGKVVSVPISKPLYEGAPSYGGAIATIFEKGIGGLSTKQGNDWAHTLYDRFYSQKEKFNHAIVEFMSVDPECVSSYNDPTDKTGNRVVSKWDAPYPAARWPVASASLPHQKLETLQTLQAYRGADNKGISPLTYEAYGENFTDQYAMAEKMGRLRIFLKTLTDTEKSKPVRYECKDEKELTLAAKVIKSMGCKFEHFHSFDIDEIKPSLNRRAIYAGSIVFSPKVVTKPYTGKYLKEKVDAYIEKNTKAIEEKFLKYSTAYKAGFCAHIVGNEEHVAGLPCPHNAIGVIVRDIKVTSKQNIWRLVWYANYVRNTYIYHRKPLIKVLDDIAAQNLTKEESEQRHIMYWEPLVRPPYFAYTKAQRTKIERALVEMDLFSPEMHKMSDRLLVELVDTVYLNKEKGPVLAKTIARGEDHEQNRVGQRPVGVQLVLGKAGKLPPKLTDEYEEIQLVSSEKDGKKIKCSEASSSSSEEEGDDEQKLVDDRPVKPLDLKEFKKRVEQESLRNDNG